MSATVGVLKAFESLEENRSKCEMRVKDLKPENFKFVY